MEKFLSVTGLELDEDKSANPCGLIAKSFFNDTYLLFDSADELIKIDEKDIAWSNDHKIFDEPKSEVNDDRWIKPEEDEHF